MPDTMTAPDAMAAAEAVKSITKPAVGAAPCPFCGSADIHNWVSTDHNDMKQCWSVMCFGCECEGPHCDDEAEAIRLWNARHAPADQGAGVQRMREALRALLAVYDNPSIPDEAHLRLGAVAGAALVKARAALSAPGSEATGWRAMSEAPVERPIEVKMRGRIFVDKKEVAICWVATAILHEPNDHWTDGASILHYNGQTLVGGFKGPFTGWRELPPAEAASR